MTRFRALVCFAVFLGVTTLMRNTLHDAIPLIGWIFGIGCGLLATALVATVVVSLGDRRTSARRAGYWWRETTTPLMSGKDAA